MASRPLPDGERGACGADDEHKRAAAPFSPWGEGAPKGRMRGPSTQRKEVVPQLGVGAIRGEPHCADLSLRKNGAIRLARIAPYGRASHPPPRGEGAHRLAGDGDMNYPANG